jgi:uncharacterized protein (DUF1778 family)
MPLTNVQCAPLRRAISAACLLLASTIATAHDTWLMARAHAADSNQITLALTTGDHFPKFDGGSAPDRVQRAALIDGDSVQPLIVNSASSEALLFSATRTSDVAIGVAQLKPRAIELNEHDARRYIAELGSPPAILQRYEALKRWREVYSKNAKIWLRTGPAKASQVLLQPQNLPYEFVPRVDPTTLRDGDKLTVCAFSYGKQVPDAYIGIVYADGQASFQRATKSGCTRFRLQSAANLMIRGVHIKAADLPDADWESHFATLTVYTKATY